MNAQPTALAAKKQNRTQQERSNQEIDLMILFSALLDRKLLICLVALIFGLSSIIYVQLVSPVYKATALIQVEKDGGGMPGFDDMSSMLQEGPKAIAEIELLRSRRVIVAVINKLRLDNEVKLAKLPLVGDFIFRNNAEALSEPFFGINKYAWGGEKVVLKNFSIPVGEKESPYEVKYLGGEDFSVSKNGIFLFRGVVGETVVKKGVTLHISAIVGNPGLTFYITKKNIINVIDSIQQRLGTTEKGKDSGIIEVSFQGTEPYVTEKVLSEITETYVRQNVERSSAEAQKALEFLRKQLPDIKLKLEESEVEFNEFQRKNRSINISLEAEGLLEQITELDTKLQELEIKRLDISGKFKSNHPNYIAVAEQLRVVSEQRDLLFDKVSKLPKTQQELLRLRRNVEVNNEIYMTLLGKAQELDIERAGTIGNVLIIDDAMVNVLVPIKPRKVLIVILFIFIGIAGGVIYVLISKALHKGVEDPNEIEALGLPVYASVPYSDYQDKLTGFSKAKKGRNKPKTILAVDNPADLSIEALRSLRTSLHFAMMEAKNNIIAISGPSPGVGKSFISVNLATVLAQSGKKVLIIDADMRKGYLQTQFGLKWDDGLSDYLSGRLSLAQVTKPTQVEGLNVITRGQIPPNPSELLMHANFSKLVEEVSAQYDLVIIDTPPILAVTDPAIVSAHAGTTLLVTRFGQNHIKEIELTRARFEQNGIDVKGVVFNGVVKKASNAYGYYGYYNYEYKSDK